MNLDFCPNKASKEYRELASIFGDTKAYFLWMRNKGNHLDKAPNGALSKLFNTLLEEFKGDRTKALKAKAKTYSNDFFNWFGNWTGTGSPKVKFYGATMGKTTASKLNINIVDFDDIVRDDIKKLAKELGKTVRQLKTESGTEYVSLLKNAIETWRNDTSNNGKTLVVSNAALAKEPIFDNTPALPSKEEFIKRQVNRGEGNPSIAELYYNDLVNKWMPKGFIIDNRFVSDIETVSKVVDENGEPLVVWHGSRISNNIEEFKNDNTFFADRYTAFSYTPFDAEDEREYMYPCFLSIKNPKIIDARGNFWNNIEGESTDDIAKSLSGNDGAIISNLKDYSDFTPGNPELSVELLNEVPLHTDYITSSSDQIKHIDNRDGEYTGPNIYHNRGENISDIESEINKYYSWLGRAKKRLEQASPAKQEQVKNELEQEFNSLGFKHFEIHPMFSKPGNRWYLATRDSMDKKDIQDLKKLAKAIGYTESGVHTFSNDLLETLLRFLFSQTHGESQHMRDVCNILWYALKHRTIKIQYVENSYKDSPAFYDHETGIITVNINGAFINSNGYSNVAAQSILHELLHAITVDTIKRSPELRNQLLELFNKVKKSARIKYDGQENAYGLTDMYEFLAELSNEDFVKSLLNIHTGTDKSLLHTIYDFIRTVASKILSRIFKQHNGTAYADAMEILVKAALPKDFKVKLQEKPLDEQTVFNIISSRLQAAEKEAQRIAVRMNILYREYEKIKSKTPSQERLANQIFEANNELKQHMDISAIGIALEQAKLTLGQYDPITNGPAVMQRSNIYKYLYDKSQQGFTGMTPDQLVDMYRNSIKFYLDLINGIPSDRVIDLSDADKRNIELIQSLIKNYIMPLWTEAIIKVGDDIVDAQVDQEVSASDQDKADMKKVAKDWLHKNIMYGDLNIVTNYVYNYSYSSNPIIKQAFHLIQYAEQKTLEEMHHIAPKLMRAYQKANKGLNSITPGWQSVMMEFDDEGKPTGNFLRDINYGQYQKDLKNFRETLNSDFLDDYGFTYVTDDTGAIVNSLTGEYAEDEEWGPNGEMPKYVEYLRAIEIFKGPRVFRRFTENYYLERLTRPYDGTIDPMSPEFKDTRFNHGLSPKTLKRYSYYQTNINYYLNKCQDSDTGLIYPERLSSDDRLALENWNAAFDKFKDIFNEDGSYKSGEDLKMAYEVRAWQKWIGERSNSTRFQDSFNAELKRILQECQQTGNMQPYNIFLKHNASEGINPDYIEQTVGSFRSYHTETDSSYKARILRKALQDAVKSPLKYGRTLMDMKNRPLFWLHCKSSDQAIDDARDPDDKGNSGWTPQQVEEYKKKFYNREILYTDEYGQYIDENGNQVQPNSQQANILEEEGKLLTVRQYLINYYTDEALRNGHVEGLIDESTGNYVDFSGMTAVDIKNLITKLMSYRRRNFEEDGSITEEYVPLTIFSMLWPTEKEFYNKRTGKREKTIVYLGEGRFKESYSSFTTSALDFNPNEGIAEKPNTTFDNGRYDNSVKYKEMRKNLDVADLYDDLIETMLDMLSIYSTNRKFNFRLPQINARMSALFSRIIKRGYSEKSLSAIWNAMTNIEANDDDMRTKEDYFVGVDGEVANTVPLKFIRNLKNPEDISTDLVSSVIMFADMALNYKNKTAIDSTLKVLRYNMDEATRMTDKNRYGLFGGKLESNEYSKLMFDSMLNSHMYGNQWTGKNKQGGPSRTKIATFKTVEAFLSFESGAMLGLNFFSMSVGFADSLTRIFSESAAGKYMTPGDCLFALGVCLWNTPKCIKNMFNPLANNKMTALMLMNGISKGTYGIYTKADWGKGRKFFTNLLMGGWSMLDWMANALLMVAFYHNCRFYEGGEIPTGFYTKYEMQKEFAKIGKSKSYANNIHHNWSNYGKRVTLWDAYYYNGKGEVFVKPEYEQYVTQRVKTNIATKTKKRGALYNGMNPDNDVPLWKRDVIGRLVGALRAWIPQQIQHLFAGGTDNIVRGIYEETKYQTTSSGTRAIPVLTNMTQAEVDAILAEKSRAIAAGENTTSKEFKKRIKDIRKLVKDVENSRRFSWDYETGTTLDQIIVGLWRSINTIYRKINQWALHKPRTAKLSEVEKYAMKDAIIFMAMLSLMMVGWTYTHDWAREVPKPKDRYEAGPMSWWNPVDYYNYMRDVYIPNEYWRLAVDDIYFRTIEAKISNISPFQVLDIVNAATALKSGADDQFNLLGLGWDLINGSEDIDAIQKQGAYKFYTQGERNFYRGIGFLKNTHTFLTYEGATNNLRWYTNRFGRVFRMVGYDFKAKDKEKQKIEGFQGGDFSGGNFQGGDFSGGNFEGGNF